MDCRSLADCNVQDSGEDYRCLEGIGDAEKELQKQLMLRKADEALLRWQGWTAYAWRCLARTQQIDA